MKTVSAREFYHDTSLVDALAEGDELLVTSNGKPKFIVTRYGSRPEMTRAIAQKRAIAGGTPHDFDTVSFLRALKK